MKRLILGLLGALALMPSAIAVPTEHYETLSDGRRRLWLYGQPNSTETITQEGHAAEVTVTVNACGLLIIPKRLAPLSSWFGTAFVLSTPGNESQITAMIRTNTPQTLPKCSNGQLAEPRTENFPVSDGRFVIVNRTPGTQVKVTGFGQPKARTLKFNACGQAKLTETVKGQFPVGRDNELYLTLTRPTTPAKLYFPAKPLLCRNGVLYQEIK